MVPLRSAIGLVLSSALLGVGCIGPTQEGRMRPEPAYAVQNELGYNDVVRLSHEYAIAQGYEVTEVAEAVQLRPNYWRVRFGMPPKGSGKLLDLEFDQTQQRVIGATEVGGPASPAGQSPPGR